MNYNKTSQFNISKADEDVVEDDELTDEEDLPTWGSSDESSGMDSDEISNKNSDMISRMTVQNVQWKPKSETTYETLVLTSSEFNSRVRGAGFRADGRAR